jgi:[acyl-carrier-protein] S-malonyltransferase
MPADRTLAALFPGQGVGDSETRELVRSQRPDLLALATQLAGADPFERIGEATRYAQPAIYCASIAGFERLGRPDAALLAGHSLGEIAALAAAGAVDELEGLRIASERGRLMDLAAEDCEPSGMLAVGADRRQAVELAARHQLSLANLNSPSQSVLSGSVAALDAALADAREQGLRAKRLAVAGAFHSPFMAAAVDPFGELLASIDFRRPDRTVVSCVTAEPFESDPRGSLIAALTEPVRWVETMEALHAAGARRFLDVGPGRVLAKLVPRILDGVEVVKPQEPAHV